MAGKRDLLWVGDTPAPPNVEAAAGDSWRLRAYRPDEPLGTQLDSARMALVCPNGAASDPRRLSVLLNALDRTQAVAVLMLPDDAHAAWAGLSRRRGQFFCVRQDIAAGDLSSRLAAAADLQPAIQNLRAELAAARHIGAEGERRIEELDEEMRLAARLQRDFLPRRLPEVGPARFSVLYRPLGWVSGDIYDVARLDETHVGFYVADAVGHGMPAALLTMFVKKALQTKRIVGHAYQIVPPEVSLTELNADICEQNLSSCQFCTAVYCVLDTSDLTLTYARAGHPEPVLIRADGSVETLSAPGSLLGVFPDEQFEARQVRLAPGDRLLLFTDGVEEVLRRTGDGHRLDIKDAVAPLIGLPRDEVFLRLTSWLDARGDGEAPEDDATVVAMDIEA